MNELWACPFCREMFAGGEVRRCPECGVDVVPFTSLSPSEDAKAIDGADPVPPEDEILPWAHSGRSRGALLMVALAGLGVFFAPWLHERTPEIRTLNGFEFARLLGWLWGAAVGWLVMIALVITRRTIRQMRGARLAVAIMAALVLATVGLRIALVPKPHPLVPLRFDWGWGLYACGGLALLALGLSLRFGGSTADMPTAERRRGDETLH
jgi:hypothetical protein